MNRSRGRRRLSLALLTSRLARGAPGGSCLSCLGRVAGALGEHGCEVHLDRFAGEPERSLGGQHLADRLGWDDQSPASEQPCLDDQRVGPVEPCPIEQASHTAQASIGRGDLPALAAGQPIRIGGQQSASRFPQFVHSVKAATCGSLTGGAAWAHAIDRGGRPKRIEERLSRTVAPLRLQPLL